MKPKIDPAEQLRARIDSKKGFIRYLKNRISDPKPLLNEIARRKREIKVHVEAIKRFRAILADTPAALVKANAELKQLEAKLQEIAPKSVTKSELELKIARLEAMLGALREQAVSGST